MGIISDKISWLRDGERANAALFNRPLSQVVSEIENRLFNVDGTTTSSTLKRAFEPSDKGTIASGDFVYLDPNTGKLEKAIADGSEKANVLGICQITRSQAGQEELSVATQGEVKIIGKTLEVGKNYYLSAQTAGDFSTDETDVLLGIALKEDVLLIKASGKSSGKSDAEIEATYAKKTDLDTLATKTELGDYLSKTDAETTYAKKTDLDSVAVDISQEQGNKLIEKPDGLFVSAVSPDELTTSLAEYVRKDEAGTLGGGITAEYVADTKTLRLTGIKF